MTLSEYIMAHAENHYEDGGWDVVVECWTLKEIDEYLTEVQVTTQAQALDAMERLVGVWADRQADARNSAF